MICDAVWMHGNSTSKKSVFQKKENPDITQAISGSNLEGLLCRSSKEKIQKKENSVNKKPRMSPGE